MSTAFVTNPLFERVERARRRKPRVTDSQITLAHGSGGRAMHDLVEGLFLDYLRNPLLEKLEDQAVFEVGPADHSSRVAFTTDSYVVDPIFFPGGNIGDLAVNGTVNDLAMSGARPLYLSAGFILEEGFPMDDLRRVLASMRDAAAAAGVQIVTGDTKVVQRGGADKIFINTAGIGLIEAPVSLSASGARPGDKVILSGTLGDHGTTIMIARGELDLETDIESDSAPLHTLVRDMMDEVGVDGLDALHCLRDPTRGGVATTLNEIALSSEVCVEIMEDLIPVREEVKGACEILGLDPLYVANEGKLLAIVAPEVADRLVARMRENRYGLGTCIIGEVKDEPRGIVSMKTGFGGTRIVDMLVGEQLPHLLEVKILDSMGTLALLGLGLVYGLKHATEADHVVAVSTIVSEHRNVWRSAVVGGLWGIGHTFALVVVGVLVLALRVAIPDRVGEWLELGVAVMIIALGASALIRSLRRPAQVHLHKHSHDGVSHLHVHFHEPETQHIGRARSHSHAIKQVGIKPFLVGAIHGLAGSGALIIIVVAQTGSVKVGLLYLAIFGIGSVGGMLLMSALIGLPFALTSRFNGIHHGLQTTAGVLSIAFGCWYGYQVWQTLL